MSIGSHLLRYSDRELVIFDFEANRVNLLEDTLPFECAFFVANRKSVTSRQSYYLRWPNYRISKDAARITRFNPEWVANGDDPEFVLEAFESHTLNADRWIVGHSILGYDIGVWNLWREALGRKRTYEMLPRVIDTHLLARAWKENWRPPAPVGTPEFLAWQFKVAAAHRKGVKTNLTQMCKDLQIEIDESKTHGGSYDLEMNVQVYWKLIWLLEV